MSYTVQESSSDLEAPLAKLAKQIKHSLSLNG
ncbi:hypothetical protein J2W71_001234 [Pseudomonas sp. 3400]|uniref:Uncharacterized protein n=1 Tax=Ectopseudomonas alcaliphila TaxID=101564 RepID=A0A1G7BGE8_9GAMM|nr:hypothetical protein [Pseudomonas sp. 3400]MDR7011335.1 hypothetical protein [Pseudomonas alcaliphila]SDE26198.1 hypothetical protein SAMN05216575_102237 [Pseudomonas alcaliphila]